MIHTIPLQQAQGSVKDNYLKIIKAIDTDSLPLFFTYLGAFPEYLSYITEQLTENLQNRVFLGLNKEIGEQLQELIRVLPDHNKERTLWIEQYKHIDSFYNFQKDLSYIYSTNMKIMFLFIALREAVKGWAIGAKKLPQPYEEIKNNDIKDHSTSDFIFDIPLNRSSGIIERENVSSQNITSSSFPLALRNSQNIQKDLLGEYLSLCKQGFEESRKTELFVITRVSIEKVILSCLAFMPNLIFSPINVTLELTKSYKNYPELLYLLCEQFPTLAVQRVMFSGYLRKDI